MDAPGGTFTAVSAGRDFSCGIKTDGTVACWGNNQYQSCQTGSGGFECTEVRSNQLDAPEGTFTAVSVSAPSTGGHAHSCAIRFDGSVACWGDNRYGQLNAPEGTFTAIAAGNGHWSTNGYSCGVRSNGTIACWGANSNARRWVPPGQFTHISLSAYGGHSYAINTDGGVEYVRWW